MLRVEHKKACQGKKMLNIQDYQRYSGESRDDKSTALVAKRTDNQQFKALLQDMNVQIIF